VKFEGQGQRSKFKVTGGNKSSATAEMADRGLKADLNSKL